MFGHVRGAFTDARQDREGRFEMADGGTIFLDEIGDLDPASQVKLLRVLQDRTFEVLGSSQRRTVDVRVVSATNRNLAEMVAPRRVPRGPAVSHQPDRAARCPPLRDRRDDIPILAARFLQAVGQVYRRDGLRLSRRCDPAGCGSSPGRATSGSFASRSSAPCSSSEDAVLTAADFRRTAEMEPGEPGRDVLPPVGSMTMDEIEKAMIVKSLKHHGGNVIEGGRSARPEPRGALSPVREVRDSRVTLRAKFVLYLVVVHGLLAWAAVWLIRTNAWWLFAAEAVFIASFSTGLFLIHRFFASLDFIRDSAQLLEDSDLMSRYREVGQPGIDRLVRVYNRMVDSLREERVRLQEQQQFLARVLRESPGGILVLDFDGRVEMVNPAALRLLQADAAGVNGRSLVELDRPLTSDLAALPEGQSRVLALVGRATGAGSARHVSRSRFPAQLLSARRADRGVAAVGEGGVREADSDAVARGQQHRRGVELAAELVSQLRRAASHGRSRRLRARHRRRHRPDGRAQHVHAELCRRRAAAAAAPPDGCAGSARG